MVLPGIVQGTYSGPAGILALSLLSEEYFYITPWAQYLL